MKRFFIALSMIASTCTVAQEVTRLDSTFATNGIAATERFEPFALSIQEDGKILVGGGGIGLPAVPPSLCRFNTEGTIDSTFGNMGMAELPELSGEKIIGVSQLSDGKILAVAGRNKFNFIRLLTDGNLDTTFGIGGIMTTNVMGSAGHFARPAKMMVMPDGKVLVCGTTWYQANPDDLERYRPLIAKFNADLSPDSTFNGTGYYAVNKWGHATHFVLDEGDNITILFGFPASSYSVIKMSPSGEPDSSFDDDGMSVLDLPAGSKPKFNDMDLLEDGGLLLTGSFTAGAGAAVLVRTLPNGSLNPEYGLSGVLHLNSGAVKPESASETVMLDGQCVSGVAHWNTESYDLGLVYSKLVGAVNIGMDDDGHVRTEKEGDQTQKCLTRLVDGKLLVAGFDNSSMLLAKYIVGEEVPLSLSTISNGHIAVYPNPSTHSITLEGVANESVIKIYNIQGQEVLQSTIKSNLVTIDLEFLPAGIYILKTNNKTTRVVKL